MSEKRKEELIQQQIEQYGDEKAYRKLVDYRLDSIEKVLNELKDVMVTNKMQEKDIQDLDRRVCTNAQAIVRLDERLEKLEVAPIKKQAARWENVVKTVIDLLVKAFMVYMLAKIGLKV